MWLMFSDCFFSIVKKGCNDDEVLVRARRRGDIHKVWPLVKVCADKGSDYAYRAIIRTSDVADALAQEVHRVTYTNFKDSVTDDSLHDAYFECWAALAELQDVGPMRRKHPLIDDSDYQTWKGNTYGETKPKRKNNRSGGRGSRGKARRKARGKSAGEALPF